MNDQNIPSMGGIARKKSLPAHRRREIARKAGSTPSKPICKKCRHKLSDHRWLAPRADKKKDTAENYHSLAARKRGRCYLADCTCPGYVPDVSRENAANPHIGSARTTPSPRR